MAAGWRTKLPRRPWRLLAQREQQVRAATRFRRNINVGFDTLGFRVARTIKP
jgi:hypothetical protein